MATDSVKHVPTLSGAAISTEMKSFFTAVKPTKTIITFVYASFITFVAFTVYLAFTPSLITFVYSVSSYILPNVTAVTSPSNFTTNTTSRAPAPRGSLTPATLKSSAANETNILSIKNASLSRTEHASVHLCPNNNTDKQAPLSVNSSASPMRKQSRTKREIKSLKNCEFFEGEWVKDDSYPLYKPGTCTIIDQQFNCMANGRPDVEFYKLKWKPKECTLPRLDGGKEWEAKDKNGTKKETLRLDMMGKSSEQYIGADVLVFNTGSWWTHDKTSKGEDYYQEGSNVYPILDVDEAFTKALTTWGRWVDKYVNPNKSLVFFSGYSPSHFSGGQWNAGGACDDETEPIKNETYLRPYPTKMEILESVLRGMKTPVTYLNITRLTDYRKDAHPSVYRKQKYTVIERRSPLLYQDCSHWCLPGVPDSWNEILYAEMLVKLDQLRGNRRQKPKLV
ncbi:Protein trichome birefringence-like 1 [Raphanus sativus]|nr:Protein trichome birefringence-like 1 [Raphanus sativus]KAJ4885762.1 Protein trichome birefringence-like 1 [Raphanus sativus]